MATTRNGVFFVLSAVIISALAYPTTVPPTPEVCSKMTPGHGPSPQKSESPYTIEVSSTQVKGGSIIQVTLDGHGKTFKGFYVQARDASGTRIGTFIPDDGIVKVHGCGGIKNNGAHHSGKDDKSNVVVHWKAPQKYDGTVTFIATVVQEFETFWTGLKSGPVTISGFSKLDKTSKTPPAFTDSREKRATPKATQEGRILNYNPYSPSKSDEENVQELLYTSSPFMKPENLQENLEKSNRSSISIASTRIRKSYYIPQPQHDIYDGENCRFHKIPSGIGGSNVRPVPVSDYATRYKYMRGQSPVNYPILNPYPSPLVNTNPTSEGPVKGGFHYLDDGSNSKYGHRHQSPQFGIIPTSSRKVKFYDDSTMPSRQHFPANYYPSSSSTPYLFRSRQPEYHDIAYPGKGYPSPQHKPAYSGWSQSSGLQPQPVAKQYGTISNDYPVIDTAIVLPKDMQSFDIPRYGYLVYNPSKGPPFYIIPAETEAFENAHFAFAQGRSKRPRV